MKMIGRVAAVTAAFWSFGAGAEEPIKLRASHFLPPQSTVQTQLLQPWAERVEKESNGRIKVEIYPSMQLGGKPPQLFDQVRTGVADIVWTLPGYTPGRFPKTEVFELPFMTGSTAEATTLALWDIYNKHLQDEYKDVHVLLLHTHAPGLIHTKSGLVTTIDDLKGRKIRMPTKSIGEALKHLGAVPVGMPVPEVYEALSRGVVDGAAIPWEVVRPLRVNEVAPHHTETGIYTSVFLLAMNKQKYDSLPDDLKAIIDRNSGGTIAAAMGKAWDDAEVPGLQNAKELGHKIHALSPEEKAKWIKATQPVVDGWVKNTPNGQQLVDDSVAAIAKHSKQ